MVANDVLATPEMPPSDRPEDSGWLRWNQPLQLLDGLYTPFHHSLVEIRVIGSDETRALNPLDVLEDSGIDTETVMWRPMPWVVYEGRLRSWSGSLIRETVFEGKDGHLFHTNNSVCEQIIEGRGLTESGCRNWLTILDRRLAWCAARGISYRMLVIPEHHAIYPDKLPGNPPLSGERPIMRIIRAADSRLRDAIIYPLDALREARAKHETSYPHDVHFTRYGAFLCYQHIMRSLPDLAPERLVHEHELTYKEWMVAGDMARVYGWPPRQVGWCDPPSVQHKSIVKTGTNTDNQVTVFETDRFDLPRLVMFRTSNSAHLFPFLFHHCSRLTAVSGTRMFFDLAESESPQAVITEIPERFLAGRPQRWAGDADLVTVPNDGATSTFEQVMGLSLPLAGAPMNRAVQPLR